LLYIKFVSYAFLRPIEVNRLKIGDINLIGRNIKFKAKNSPHKTKILPEILMNDLPDMTALDKELVLFTRDGIGGEWEANNESRRDYFPNCFFQFMCANLLHPLIDFFYPKEIKI